ncbi:SDR family oxidoreductase [Leifsonia sp. PS1209]|uniref:SDR family oxidoreductase n=1 Tax=Leifsonia sp. PS1209 TaxID=2724914 RepID=UPI001442C43D|nr:SDR family oxidoreductase [Leifsonia sp. PS1209]QIZ97467.1 SDR family oxidoreductase [Leifsonia sp. PS1209]
MKIVVIGGTGLIGGPLVDLLRQAGHDVVAASPSTGVNSVTGEGLSDALAGADVVLDIPNSPSFADDDVLDFFQRSTTNLVEAQKAAGVGHHIVLSIVGADRMHDIGYMRAKVAQENIVTASGVPYSIVRATQFFEFIPRLAEGAADGDTIRLSPVMMQPIAAADVSAALADIATRPPTNGIAELAGPEQLRLADLGRRVLEARGDTRTVVADPDAGYYGGVVSDTSLVPGNDPAITALRIGPTRFEEWLGAAGGN